MSDTPRSSRVSWMISAVFCALMIFLVYMAIGLFATGDMVGGIGFTIFAVCALFSAHQPKWLQKFAQN